MFLALDCATVAQPPVREVQDHLDQIVAQWARAWPELDTEPIAVVGRVLRVARHLEREIERVLDEFDLGLSEFNLLAALRRSSPPRVSPVELSRQLIISSGGVVKRIDRLEHEGLVKRLPHPTDGRGLLVELTPAGRRLFDRAMVAHLENERRLLMSVNGPDREQLAWILRDLLVALEGDTAGGRQSP
jgi:DNA-binding MarR family transcriptional regulator